MVESYVVASTWCVNAGVCFTLSWLTAIWICSGLALRALHFGATPPLSGSGTPFNVKIQSFVRAGLIVMSLFEIAIVYVQMDYMKLMSNDLQMIQESRAHSHLPLIPSTQLMKLGVETYWSFWLVIALALSCAALLIADSLLREIHPQKLKLVYAAFIVTWLCGAGLTGTAAWISQQSYVALRSSQLMVVVLNAFFGIAVLVYFIIIHRQRKIVKSSPDGTGCDQDEIVQEQP